MPREASRTAEPRGMNRGSFTVLRMRSSQGSWSRPIRTRRAADLSSASWPGLTSTVCGSWMGGARLWTRTASPPTASTRDCRSVEVVTTGRGPPPQAGAAAISTSAVRTARSTLLLGGEDAFRDHAVHTLANVHHLGHDAVRRHRGDRVRFVAIQGDHLLLRQEVDHLARGDDHGLVEVLVVPHQDPMSLGLEPGPFQLHVLADDELHDDLPVRALERRQVQLGTLPAMRITDPNEAALEKDGHEERGAFLKLVDVHIGGVLPRPERRDRGHGILDASLARRGVTGVDADRQDAGERLEIDHDARLEFGLALVPVQVKVLHEAIGELGGQGADRRELLARQVEVDPEGLGNDLQDPDLHHVAGLGAVDIDGTGDGVRTAAGVGLPEGDDLLDRGSRLDLIVRVHQGLDSDGVSRADDELGWLLGVEPAPLARLECRRQHVVLAARDRDHPIALGLVGRLRERVDPGGERKGQSGEARDEPLAGLQSGHSVSPFGPSARCSGGAALVVKGPDSSAGQAFPARARLSWSRWLSSCQAMSSTKSLTVMRPRVAWTPPRCH